MESWSSYVLIHAMASAVHGSYCGTGLVHNKQVGSTGRKEKWEVTGGEEEEESIGQFVNPF